MYWFYPDKMFDGTIKTLSDVRHIPSLKRNGRCGLRAQSPKRIYLKEPSCPYKREREEFQNPSRASLAPLPSAAAAPSFLLLQHDPSPAPALILSLFLIQYNTLAKNLSDMRKCTKIYDATHSGILLSKLWRWVPSTCTWGKYFLAVVLPNCGLELFKKLMVFLADSTSLPKSNVGLLSKFSLFIPTSKLMGELLRGWSIEAVCQ